jgi:hypothetical protein
MAWIKLSEELYLSDQSPYSLEKIDGIWYVVDNSTQKKSIPFADIFNNPVFPIDYSNTDLIVKSLTSPGVIEGKHFRGESANTPGTPAFSFQGDIDTGFFRKSANVMGISSGGTEVSEINNFGVLNGTLGTDFRNLIKRQYATLALGNPSTQSTSEVSTGIGFSYTPINAGSKLKINISITHQTSYNTQSATPSYGFLRLYSTTGSIPAAGNSPTGTAISSTIINTRAYNFSPYLWDNSTHLNLQFWVDSLNVNARNIYLVHSVGTSNLISTVYSTSYHSNYMVEEYI